MLKHISDHSSSCSQCIESLVRVLWHRDIHTQLHSSRVLKLSAEIGEACDLDQKDIDILQISAGFHDLGKVGIPDKILLKPGKLDEDEWELIKQHSEKGEDIVKALNIDNIELIAKAIRHHHEHFQGSGYPDKLSGENIPLFARIISVADSYDAMTMTRPYHTARTHKEAMAILFDEKGAKSDPYIFDKFVKLIENSGNKVL